jgi:hypothetical protein
MHLPRPKHATVVAYAALFVAMGGTAVAATGGNFILGHSNTAGSTSILKNTGTGPALKVVNGQAGFAPLSVNGNKHLVPGLNANYLGGHGPGAFTLTRLPSGKSESGMFAAGGANDTSTSGYIGDGITYRIPLAHPIADSHVIGVQGVGPVTHCAGPGHADPGYLCLYNDVGNHVDPGYAYSQGYGSPSFGVVAFWHVNGTNAYAGGVYTVTAP